MEGTCVNCEYHGLSHNQDPCRSCKRETGDVDGPDYYTMVDPQPWSDNCEVLERKPRRILVDPEDFMGQWVCPNCGDKENGMIEEDYITVVRCPTCKCLSAPKFIIGVKFKGFELLTEEF